MHDHPKAPALDLVVNWHMIEPCNFNFRLYVKGM